MMRIAVFADICPIENKEPFNVFLSDDYIIGNLECALTDQPEPVQKAGPVLYNPTSFASYLKSKGFFAVSLANNHIRDCGDQGVIATLNACEKNGIQSFGAGHTNDDPSKPLIIEKVGIRVAVLSFAEKEFNFACEGKAGATVFDPYESFDRITEAKQSADFVVVLYHGGIEHFIYPSPELQRKCRKMVTSGADVVLCQHSHCIGTREKYQGGEILYGQGNSVFGYRKDNYVWNHGLLAHLEISNEGVTVKYDVLETASNGSVALASEAVAEEILGQLERESAKILDPVFLKTEWKGFCQKQKALYLPLLYGLGTNMNRLNRLTHNKLIDLLFSRRQKNVTHNLIRCDAHREVVETLLEEYDF